MTMVITKDRFEEKGVALQESARNLEQAKDRFDGSCLRCTLFKRHADCDACPIREQLFGNVVKFHGHPADYPWVEKEFAPVD